MFQEAFKKLDLEEVALIVDQLNPLLEGMSFDPLEVTVVGTEVSFYPGYKFIDVCDYSVAPPLRRFAIYKPGDLHILDWTNGPIYALNKKVPITLDEHNVFDYIRFFFGYVRGRHGRFIVTENVDDIAWREEPAAQNRKNVAEKIIPLTLVKREENGDFIVEGRMMFKDSLFKTFVRVESDGLVALFDEELLIEDMPVLDDTFGH